MNIENLVNYHERSLTDRLRELAGVFPAIVVVGARQVGKSTLLSHTFGMVAETVVFDPVIDVGNARQDPELFLANRKTPLILDEVQYAPELVAALKRQIDRDRTPGRYILTGSQQWGVFSSLAESLAGRAVFLDLEGFSLAEIAGRAKAGWLAAYLDDPQAFVALSIKRLRLPGNLWEILWRGNLPEAQFIPLNTIPAFLQAYQRTYIERDVRLLAEVNDWHLFGRFIQLCAALTAQEVNQNQFGRELGIHHATAKKWLAMLSATFQWYEVPPYHGNSIKRLSGKRKGYFADTGLLCALQAMASPETIGGHPLWGSLFETAVMAEIRKQSSLLPVPPNIYHWRAHSGAEVDVVLEYNGVLYPIEIKASSRPKRSDVRGIAAFRDAYPKREVSPGLIVCPCAEKARITETVWSLPWDAVIEMDPGASGFSGTKL